MINRWFHRTKLHVPTVGHAKKVGWLELFYDLVYVATFIQLGNALAEHADLLGFLGFAALLVPIWYAWTGFTFFHNRFAVDDFAHRATVFVQMFAVAGVAISVPGTLGGETDAFAFCYAIARLVLVSWYVRAWWQVREARDFAGLYATGFGVGAGLWLVSIFVPAPWTYLVWSVAMMVDISVPFTKKSRALLLIYPPDVIHMSERYGLLTLIVLGESFVKVLTELAGGLMSQDVVLMGTLGLLITCCLWWIYFDDVAGSRVRARRLSAYIWIYTHLPLTIAVTAVGVGIKKAVLFSPDLPGYEKYRWLLCGTLALALLSVAIIDSVTERRQAELSDKARVRVRFASAVVVLLIAPTGAFMPGWMFLASVAAVCALQVLFDLSMAPMAEEHDESHELPTLFEAPVSEPVANPDEPRRRTMAEAVRKGTPSELRRDLYFHFMEGSWTQAFVAFAVLFVLSNAIFAALYLLEPTGVTGMAQGSFLDAFSFSVQTMATIGYGAMAPTSAWANVIMIVEAAVGLMGAALATGLLFAKASRPRSSVLFSKNMVMTTRNGVPTLMFRCGNARGNEVVEAQLRVSVLIDEVSPEGHQLRKLHDLTLVRSSTPIFTMSWTVMHEIDGTSPLRDITTDNATERIFAIVVTMTGHDATYAQTTHARTMYYPEDIRWNARFVDVMSTLEDGRLMVDYDKFHDTEPDGAAA